MKIKNQIKLDFSNVLIEPQTTTVTSRSEVNLETTITFENKKWHGIPIIASNMDTIGTFDILNILSEYKMLTCLNKFYTYEDYENYISDDENFLRLIRYGIITSGCNEKDIEKMYNIITLLKSKKNDMKIDYPIFVCIDIANGHMVKLSNICSDIKTQHKDIILIAGNVATKEGAKKLFEHGNVDIVKVGIGSGSACLTRKQTGIGVPQLSAIIECAEEAKKHNKYIIGDGGITCPGDIVKAFGGGATFVMIGGMFSGHIENPGEVVIIDNKKYKMFYGMSSKKAMNKYYGKMNKYRSSEGRELKLELKGSIRDTLDDCLGGVRSGCAYINVKNVNKIFDNVVFIRVSQQLNTSLIK